MQLVYKVNFRSVRKKKSPWWWNFLFSTPASLATYYCFFKEKLFDLLVTATCRLAFPSSMISITSSGLDTNLSLAPYRNQINPFKILLFEKVNSAVCAVILTHTWPVSKEFMLIACCWWILQSSWWILSSTGILSICSFLGISFFFQIAQVPYCYKWGNFVGLAEWPPGPSCSKAG